MKEITLRDQSNNKLHTYIWDEVDNPQGVIQISHGINEHGLRYQEFALFMNKQGYIVYLEDHVSQGQSRTSNDGDTVYFGKNGDKVLVDGLNTVRKQIKVDYPKLPIYMIGHSLGTSIVRKYLQTEQNEYSKIILNGGGLTDTKGMGLIIVIGKLLKLFGKKKPSKFFDNIFRQTQYKLREKVEMKHFIEWLTRDKARNEIDKQDSYLFIRLSVSCFVDMIQLIKDVNQIKHIKQNSMTTEILLLSGTHDPATNFGQGVVDLHNLYTQLGYNSQYKLYQEGRHDTLQEINRADVYNDILQFIGGQYDEN